MEYTNKNAAHDEPVQEIEAEILSPKDIGGFNCFFWNFLAVDDVDESIEVLVVAPPFKKETRQGEVGVLPVITGDDDRYLISLSRLRKQSLREQLGNQPHDYVGWRLIVRHKQFDDDVEGLVFSTDNGRVDDDRLREIKERYRVVPPDDADDG